MKTEQKMVLATAIACGVTFLTFVLNGCSGDDDSHCMSTEGCIGADAGPMTADADQTTPDADTKLDADSDVCSDYRWMAEKPWDCPAFGGVSQCDMELFTTGGICSVQCHDHFWIEADQLTTTREPPPASLTFYIDGEPVTCHQRL